jgi:nitric oxide reductase activation protein
MFQLMGAYSNRPSASGPQNRVEDFGQQQKPGTGEEEQAKKKKTKNKKKKNRGEACLELAIDEPAKVDRDDSNDGSYSDEDDYSPTMKMVTRILELISKRFRLFVAW